MSTVKEHLASMHERSAADHIAKSKFHAGMHKNFSKLAECAKAQMGDDDGDAGECLQGIAELHKTMASHHADEAEAHVGHAKELTRAMKAAMGGADPDTVQPMPAGLSIVAPTAPQYRAVPRTGAPPFQQRPSVPVEFTDLVKIEE
jgi:hypothetical protein